MKQLPYFSFVPDTSIAEGDSFTYNLSAEDVDGDEIIYFVNTDVNSAAHITNGILFIAPLDNYSGEIVVSITVSDGVFEISDDFVLTVIPINDPPIILVKFLSIFVGYASSYGQNTLFSSEKTNN